MFSILGLIAVLLALFLLKIDLPVNLNIHHAKKTYPLNDYLKVSQTLEASNDNLEAIELRFKKINDTDHKLVVQVWSGKVEDFKEKRADWRGEFSTTNFKNDQFYRFYFPKQNNSKGKKYTFYLGGRTATDSASLSPIISNLDSYHGGEAFINRKRVNGDVLFRPVYKTNLFHFLGYYINKIVYGKPVILGKEIIFLLGILLFWAYCLLIFSIFAMIWDSNKKKKFWQTAVYLFLALLSMLIFFYKPGISFTLKEVLN